LEFGVEIKNLNIFGKNKKVFIKRGNQGNPVVILFHGFPDNFFIWKNVSAGVDERYYQLGINLSDLAGVSLNEAKLIFLSLLKNSGLPLDNGIYFVGHDIGGPVMSYLGDVVKNDIRGSIFLNSLDLDSYRKNIISKQVFKSWYAIVFQLSPYRWAIKNNLLFGKQLFKKLANSHKGEIDFGSIDFYKLFFNSLIGIRNIPTLRGPVFYILSKDDPYIKIPSRKYLNGDITVVRGDHWSVFFDDSISIRIINKKLKSWDLDYAKLKN
jgi:pimeloyl-ACP methyl ester carboxylesterase